MCGCSRVDIYLFSLVISLLYYELYPPSYESTEFIIKKAELPTLAGGRNEDIHTDYIRREK
jgi:hypothetical protein